MTDSRWVLIGRVSDKSGRQMLLEAAELQGTCCAHLCLRKLTVNTLWPVLPAFWLHVRTSTLIHAAALPDAIVTT